MISDQDLKTTRATLEAMIEYIAENEPYAVGAMASIEQVLSENSFCGADYD